MVVHKRLRRGEQYVEDMPLNIIVQGQSLENVDDFTYVGGKENSRGNMDDEVKVRLSRMSAAFASLSDRVFMNSHLHLLTKLRMFDSVVISAGLYGCATWNIKDAQIQQLDSWKFRHLKKILRCKWSDYISYFDVIQRIRDYGIEIGTIAMTITKRRLLYLGHVMRMDDCRLPKKMLYGSINLGRRASGGQETSYHRCVKVDLEKCHLSCDHKELAEKALNRGNWIKYVNLGVKNLYDDWTVQQDNVSQERYYKKLVDSDLYVYALELPDRDVAYENWWIEKRGENWRIELKESRAIEGGLESLSQFEVRQKNRYEIDPREESKVTRDLRELRKNNH